MGTGGAETKPQDTDAIWMACMKNLGSRASRDSHTSFPQLVVLSPSVPANDSHILCHSSVVYGGQHVRMYGSLAWVGCQIVNLLSGESARKEEYIERGRGKDPN